MRAREGGGANGVKRTMQAEKESESERFLLKPEKKNEKTHVAIIPAAKPLLTLFGSRTVLMVLLRRARGRGRGLEWVCELGVEEEKKVSV